jgi:hypothetical protein
VTDPKDPEHGTRNTEHGTRNTEHPLTCVGWREGRQRWSGTRNTEHLLTCEGWREGRQRWSGTRNTEHPLTCVGWREGRQRWSVPCSRRDIRSCFPSGRTGHPHRTFTGIIFCRERIFIEENHPAYSPYFYVLSNSCLSVKYWLQYQRNLVTKTNRKEATYEKI